jgi:hypothetical protein
LKIAEEKDIGTIVMKAFAKRPWPPQVAELSRTKRPYMTWYEPFDSQNEIGKCLNYALSHNVTTLASSCDVRLVPKIIDAAERYQETTDKEREQLAESAIDLQPLFPRS